ncbi:hypothetical protein COL05_15770 [Bacillus sp. AFS059628]|uniref:hypothetical protein n=1 Tax=Bacillus sp. AFS059628 TaxID=2033508 RepID=UPI000BF736E5|nr:hypothetical protein [Bacillus sp. AFS059628]PFV80062.1 hypothetical protein COL05_15770 [Bacillus sp. AFS059628]
MTDNNIYPDALKASIKSAKRTDENIELVVRLSNTATRALHYIVDVRTRKYDPETRTLTLSLSDEGREVIPSAFATLPEFRYIDPESDAEILLKVPEKLIILSSTDPLGELAFEVHQLSDTEEVVVEVGCADVPFYKDTRVKVDMQLPAARWQQHKVRVTKRMEELWPKS